MGGRCGEEEYEVPIGPEAPGEVTDEGAVGRGIRQRRTPPEKVQGLGLGGRTCEEGDIVEPPNSYLLDPSALRLLPSLSEGEEAVEGWLRGLSEQDHTGWKQSRDCFRALTQK